MNQEQTVNKVKGLAKALSQLEGLENSKPTVEVKEQTDLYDLLITNDGLRKFTRKLFYDGHHARAVEEAFKYLNNVVKEKSNLTKEDGFPLMQKAFSPNKPVLKLNAGVSQSEQSEQQGYMNIFSGCMLGIRNPRAHDHEWEDSESRAIQLLTLANHLLDKLEQGLSIDDDIE